MTKSEAFLRAVRDFVYPPYCLLCNQPLPPGSADYTFCSGCRPVCSSTESCCKRCGEPCEDESCLVCSLFPLPFSHIRSAALYAGKTEEAVKVYKYGIKRAAARSIALCLAEAAFSLAGEQKADCCRIWDMLLPVPASKAALRKRGFNHIGLISKSLAKLLQVPADLFTLYSAKERAAQAGLLLADRPGNAENAFLARERRVKGKRILLIDDVITSGATAAAAAHALLDAQASSVDLLTFARSPHFQKNRIAVAFAESSRIHRELKVEYAFNS